MHLRSVRTAEDARAEAGAQSLSDLYERHIGRAIALARLLAGDDHVAEDLAEEAFIRAAGRFAHLRRPEAFGAYLRRTLVNLCRAHFRRLRVEREWLRRQDRREPTERAAFDPEDRDVVWQAIEDLPWRQRAAIVLRYYEDLSVAQTADVLRCSPAAAESLLSRGIASLRVVLRKQSLEEGQS